MDSRAYDEAARQRRGGVKEPPMDTYVSFLVRIWRDGKEDGPAGWHGELEHIQSGQRWTFDSLDEMHRLLRGLVGEPGIPAGPPDPPAGRA